MKVLLFQIQILKDPYGGNKTLERLYKKFTDRPTTTTLVTSRIQNWFCKTSSTGTSTQRINLQCTVSPTLSVFDEGLDLVDLQ